MCLLYLEYRLTELTLYKSQTGSWTLHLTISQLVTVTRSATLPLPRLYIDCSFSLYTQHTLHNTHSKHTTHSIASTHFYTFYKLVHTSLSGLTPVCVETVHTLIQSLLRQMLLSITGELASVTFQRLKFEVRAYILTSRYCWVLVGTF